MAGWVRPWTTVSPVHPGDHATATAAAPMPAATRPARGWRVWSAVIPAPSSTARESSTSGAARSVDRRARPAVVSDMKALSSDPTPVGWKYGKGPTASTMPTTSRTRKNERWRQRTTVAAAKARVGTRNENPMSHSSWV